MSIKNTSDTEYMLSVERMPNPDTTQGLLLLLTRILSRPYVKSVEIEVGVPLRVTWFKRMSDTLLLAQEDEHPDVVLKNVDMEEYEGDGSPKETLVDALMLIASEGLAPSFIFTGDIPEFKNWLSIPRVVALPKVEGTEYLSFMGIRLLEVPSLPGDCVVLLGSEIAGGKRTDACRALKLVT
jgi:hypothetical protein